jgi:hypothetical protein
MKLGLEALEATTPQSYDSAQDTMEHIRKVQTIIGLLQVEFTKRALVHDASKLMPPEKEAFDSVTPKLHGVTYGSPEYRETLKEIKPALDHHYQDSRNRHHPDHFANGILDMNLIDIMELISDWAASSTRHEDGDIIKSIEHNTERFQLGEQLSAILKNTVRDFGIGAGIVPNEALVTGTKIKDVSTDKGTT